MPRSLTPAQGGDMDDAPRPAADAAGAPAAPGGSPSPAPPPVAEERSTERKLVASVPIVGADSTRDAAQEDFLFHLYRGSEMLQENRVLEAKEELEYALTMQPRDAKGQDLLAAVYFRLGLYPRAISIYEQLAKQFPRDTSLKVNLALVYLKTGQPEAARAELHDVVRINPNHRRAWGYLGIAHEKIGDFDQAQVAFERGGHTQMAKRMTERRNRVTVPAPAIPAGAQGAEGEVREVAGLAFEELDAGEINFALAEPGTGSKPEHQGQWHAVELGASAAAAVASKRAPSPFSKTLAPPSIGEYVGTVTATTTAATAAIHASVTALPPPVPPGHATSPPPPSAEPPHRPTPVVSVPPPDMSRAARESLLLFPTDPAAVLHPSGVALVLARPNLPFAARLESLRLAKGAIATTVMQRRTRDQDSAEVLGGVGSPIVRIEGHAELVLGPRPTHALFALNLEDEIAFVREDLLLGFDLRLGYENGRLAMDETDGGLGVVQLRGTGALVLELLAPFVTVDAAPGRPVIARREWVVGWIGRLVPRALPASESPAGQRGLVSFNGEGTVLVAGR
jgi:uncharacterized protein (AIM24 family)